MAQCAQFRLVERSKIQSNGNEEEFNAQNFGDKLLCVCRSILWVRRTIIWFRLGVSWSWYFRVVDFFFVWAFYSSELFFFCFLIPSHTRSLSSSFEPPQKNRKEKKNFLLRSFPWLSTLIAEDIFMVQPTRQKAENVEIIPKYLFICVHETRAMRTIFKLSYWRYLCTRKNK